VIKGKTKDTIEPALMLPLGLSYDHRVVDGADGARFIRAIVENLENFSNEDAKIS
jgi:pyruvate dehydrogenase E2 component (dihydrolipoamide acetyltransferase)